MDARKLLRNFNQSAQSRVSFFEHLVKKLGDGAKKPYTDVPDKVFDSPDGGSGVIVNRAKKDYPEKEVSTWVLEDGTPIIAPAIDAEIQSFTDFPDSFILSKNGKSKTLLIHRLIAIAFIPNPNNFPEIDHIDRNSLNNSLVNLRWVSKTQNGYNRNMKTQNSSSQYRGVSWNKLRNKWFVQIKLNGKSKYIGRFETEKEGALAFNNFVISHNLEEYVDLNIL
jgi:hypothetical protein